MRIPWILLSMAIGVGLGWVLADLRHDGGSSLDAALPIERLAPPAAAGPTEPRLIGHPASEPTPAEAAPAPAEVEIAPEDIEVIEFIGGPEGLDEWEEWGISDVQSLDQRGWNALLTLYAMAGRLDDFLGAVPRALEAEMDAGTLLDLFRLLPTDQHVAGLDRLRQLFPDQPWPVGVVADVYTAAGAGERAFEVLLPAIEAGADVDLATRLVHADPDRAASVLGALVTEWDADMLGSVGSAFVAASRPELALTFLQEALAKEPYSRGVLMSLAQVDRGLALGHARDLAARDESRSDAWNWLGELEMEAGNTAAAFDAYRAAAGVELTNEALYGMMRADPERAFEAAAALVTESTGDETLGAVAKIAMKSGRPEDSLETLRQAHERDPTDHEWMVAMVTIDPTRAVVILEESARTYSGDSRDEVVGAYGNALNETGNPAEAFACYQEAFELDPSDWEWQRGLARSDPGRALPLLEARLAETGDEGDLLGAIGDAYAGTGQSSRAMEYYERAVSNGGGDEWYARMGTVDAPEALRRLSQRTQEAPSADAWAALGDLHRSLGDNAAAHAAYGQARELNGTSLVYEARWRQTAE